MYCSKCGFENPDTSSFCTKCGTRLASANPVEHSSKINASESRSVLRIVGTVLIMVSSLVAICPLTLDVLIAGWTWGNAANNETVQWGQNLSNMTTSRIGLVLITLIISIIIISIRKPSIILTILLLLVVVASIILPWLMAGHTQSLGGGIGFFFMLVSLVGSIMLIVDSMIDALTRKRNL